MHLNATGVTQHFYLPIMAITIQWPLFSVPKVTVKQVQLYYLLLLIECSTAGAYLLAEQGEEQAEWVPCP